MFIALEISGPAPNNIHRQEVEQRGQTCTFLDVSAISVRRFSPDSPAR